MASSTVAALSCVQACWRSFFLEALNLLSLHLDKLPILETKLQFSRYVAPGLVPQNRGRW